MNYKLLFKAIFQYLCGILTLACIIIPFGMAITYYPVYVILSILAIAIIGMLVVVPIGSLYSSLKEEEGHKLNHGIRHDPEELFLNGYITIREENGVVLLKNLNQPEYYIQKDRVTVGYSMDKEEAVKKYQKELYGK